MGCSVLSLNDASTVLNREKPEGNEVPKSQGCEIRSITEEVVFIERVLVIPNKHLKMVDSYHKDCEKMGRGRMRHTG